MLRKLDVNRFVELLSQLIALLETLDKQQSNEEIQFFIKELRALIDLVQSEAGLLDILTALIKKLLSYLKIF